MTTVPAPGRPLTLLVCAVVWAHNSHLGDARATSVSQMGEFNIGQLVQCVPLLLCRAQRGMAF